MCSKRSKAPPDGRCLWDVPSFAAPKRDELDASDSGGELGRVAADGGYFTTKANTVTDARTRIELVACRCSCRFCPHCCNHLGLKLRERLQPVIESFKGVVMLTLTIDPQLFPDPETAYRHTRQKRLLARLVRRLRKAGALRSSRWACVLEFQKQTQMPHWHLLVESEFVPFETLKNIWNSFRPRCAGPGEGDRPAFGHVRVSRPRFADARHAANYVTKYCTKLPEQGFPDWVLDFHGQIRLFATSRCFFEGFEEPREKTQQVVKTCDCEPCREQRDQAESEGRKEPKEHAPACFCDRCREWATGTIRQRLHRCGTGAQLFEVGAVVNESGEVVGKEFKFLSQLGVTFDEAKAVLDEVPEGRRRFFLRPEDFQLLASLVLKLGLDDDVRRVAYASRRGRYGRGILLPSGGPNGPPIVKMTKSQ